MSSKENSSKDTVEDCIECRLVSGLGCLGICSYILFQSKQMKGYSHKGMIFLGSSFGLLGLFRLLGVNLSRIKALE